MRRKISTKAARAYIAAKAARAKRNVPVPKVGPSGLARHVLKREGLLKNPGERRESRVAKARREVEELDFAEPSEGSESVEPEGSEKGESEAPEVDEEVDETIEVEDEEGSCEEVVVREEPADSSQGAVEGPSSAKGASMGSFSVAGQTGVSPVVAKGDAGTTMSSSSAMHNLLVGSLATTNRRNRELARARLDALKERSENDFLTEDEHMEVEALQEELERLDREAEELRARGPAKSAPKAAFDRLNQAHHDARYRAAVAKGVPHAKAWKAEKARRRSAIHRKQGVQDRAKVHFKMTESWTKHFWEGGPEQPEDRQDSQREAEPDLPTVVIDKRGNEVAPASSKVYLRPLTRKEKTYYREEGPTELKPSVVPAVYAKKANRSEEARKEANRKRAARRKRLAGKGKWKSNVKKRQRSWQEEDEESDDPTWGNWQDPDQDPDRDPEDKGKDWWKDHPGGPGGGPAMAAVCSVASTSDVSSEGGKVEVNFDTGAAVTVIPLEYGTGNEVGSETKYRTASGDAIKDAGPCTVKGRLRNGTDTELTGRLAPVHRILASGTEVCKTQHAVLTEHGGLLIPRNGEMGRELTAFMGKLVRKYKGDMSNATKLTVRRGVYCFDMKVPKGQPAGA